MDTIVKVFTKHDKVYYGINLPRFKNLKPENVIDHTELSLPDLLYLYDVYKVDSIEEGLEGVKFVHYRKG